MPHILLIEPDRILADVYRQALTVEGYSVIMCAGAQSAITAADSIQPDLVILELQLIEHSGIEFLYEFRSYPEWRSIPAVVLSSVPPNEFLASREILTNELGVRQYLYKPMTSLQSLLTSVSELAAFAA